MTPKQQIRDEVPANRKAGGNRRASPAVDAAEIDANETSKGDKNRCRYCGRSLGLIQRLALSSYCSKEHEEMDRQNRVQKLARLLGADKDLEDQPPESGPQPSTGRFLDVLLPLHLPPAVSRPADRELGISPFEPDIVLWVPELRIQHERQIAAWIAQPSPADDPAMAPAIMDADAILPELHFAELVSGCETPGMRWALLRQLPRPANLRAGTAIRATAEAGAFEPRLPRNSVAPRVPALARAEAIGAAPVWHAGESPRSLAANYREFCEDPAPLPRYQFAAGRRHIPSAPFAGLRVSARRGSAAVEEDETPAEFSLSCVVPATAGWIQPQWTEAPPRAVQTAPHACLPEPLGGEAVFRNDFDISLAASVTAVRGAHYCRAEFREAASSCRSYHLENVRHERLEWGEPGSIFVVGGPGPYGPLLRSTGFNAAAPHAAARAERARHTVERIEWEEPDSILLAVETALDRPRLGRSEVQETLALVAAGTALAACSAAIDPRAESTPWGSPGPVLAHSATCARDLSLPAAAFRGNVAPGAATDSKARIVACGPAPCDVLEPLLPERNEGVRPCELPLAASAPQAPESRISRSKPRAEAIDWSPAAELGRMRTTPGRSPWNTAGFASGETHLRTPEGVRSIAESNGEAVASGWALEPLIPGSADCGRTELRPAGFSAAVRPRISETGTPAPRCEPVLWQGSTAPLPVTRAHSSREQFVVEGYRSVPPYAAAAAADGPACSSEASAWPVPTVHVPGCRTAPELRVAMAGFASFRAAARECGAQASRLEWTGWPTSPTVHVPGCRTAPERMLVAMAEFASFRAAARECSAQASRLEWIGWPTFAAQVPAGCGEPGSKALGVAEFAGTHAEIRGCGRQAAQAELAAWPDLPARVPAGCGQPRPGERLRIGGFNLARAEMRAPRMQGGSAGHPQLPAGDQWPGFAPQLPVGGVALGRGKLATADFATLRAGFAGYGAATARAESIGWPEFAAHIPAGSATLEAEQLPAAGLGSLPLPLRAENVKNTCLESSGWRDFPACLQEGRVQLGPVQFEPAGLVWFRPEARVASSARPESSGWCGFTTRLQEGRVALEGEGFLPAEFACSLPETPTGAAQEPCEESVVWQECAARLPVGCAATEHTRVLIAGLGSFRAQVCCGGEPCPRMESICWPEFEAHIRMQSAGAGRQRLAPAEFRSERVLARVRNFKSRTACCESIEWSESTPQLPPERVPHHPGRSAIAGFQAGRGIPLRASVAPELQSMAIEWQEVVPHLPAHSAGADTAGSSLTGFRQSTATPREIGGAAQAQGPVGYLGQATVLPHPALLSVAVSWQAREHVPMLPGTCDSGSPRPATGTVGWPEATASLPSRPEASTQRVPALAAMRESAALPPRQEPQTECISWPEFSAHLPAHSLRSGISGLPVCAFREQGPRLRTPHTIFLTTRYLSRLGRTEMTRTESVAWPDVSVVLPRGTAALEMSRRSTSAFACSVPRLCEQTATAVRTVHADWGQPASVMPHLAVDMPRLSAPSAGRTAASEPESIFWRNSPNKARSLRGEGYADWKTTLRLLLPDMERWTASAIPETRREMLRWLRLADSPVCAVRFKRRLCYPKARVEPPQPVQAEPALLGPDAVPPGVSTLAPPKLSGPVPIASDYTESTDWFLTLAYESEKDSAA